MKVKDAMHAGVTWVGPDTRIGELARSMRDEGIGSIPVGENDRLIGMVTDRDIAIKAFADGKDPASLTARDVMHGPILYCRTEEDIDLIGQRVGLGRGRSGRVAYSARCRAGD